LGLQGQRLGMGVGIVDLVGVYRRRSVRLVLVGVALLGGAERSHAAGHGERREANGKDDPFHRFPPGSSDSTVCTEPTAVAGPLGSGRAGRAAVSSSARPPVRCMYSVLARSNSSSALRNSASSWVRVAISRSFQITSLRRLRTASSRARTAAAESPLAAGSRLALSSAFIGSGVLPQLNIRVNQLPLLAGSPWPGLSW